MLKLSRRSILGAGATSMVLAGTSLAAPTAAAAAASKSSILRLAWAGIRIERGDTALFIDAVAPSPDDGRPGPAISTQARRSFALVTHSHGDHCDPKALQPVLGERGYLVAHEDAARLFDTRIVKVQPARFYEPIILSRSGGEFVAFCVPASDGLGSPQVSWIIDDGQHRFIHCGDTAWHGGWWDIARAYGPFDIAFLPINGLRQTQGRFKQIPEPMSLTPEQAVEAAAILNAKAVVPIHFGSTGDPSYVEEKNLLERFVATARRANVAVKLLAPGEGLAL